MWVPCGEDEPHLQKRGGRAAGWCRTAADRPPLSPMRGVAANPAIGVGDSMAPDPLWPPILAAPSAGNHGLSLSTASARPAQDYQKRELYLFALYRVLEAGLLVLLVFGPVAKLQPEEGHEALVAGVSITYFAIALLLLMQARLNSCAFLRALVFASSSCRALAAWSPT